MFAQSVLQVVEYGTAAVLQRDFASGFHSWTCSTARAVVSLVTRQRCKGLLLLPWRELCMVLIASGFGCVPEWCVAQQLVPDQACFDSPQIVQVSCAANPTWCFTNGLAEILSECGCGSSACR